MDFIKSIRRVEVMFHAEAVIRSGEVVESLVTFGGGGVRFVAGEAFKNEGGRHVPPGLV